MPEKQWETQYCQIQGLGFGLKKEEKALLLLDRMPLIVLKVWYLFHWATWDISALIFWDKSIPLAPTQIQVQHPAAKSMIEISRTQDEEVGDGTTSVIILGEETDWHTLHKGWSSPFFLSRAHDETHLSYLLTLRWRGVFFTVQEHARFMRP